MTDVYERETLSKVSLVIAGVLVAWFALVFVLGASGAFVRPPGTPPIPMGIGATAPIIIFLAAFRMSRTFRDFVMTADLRLCTGIQAWRFAGLAFIALYAQGTLPGLFAWPAGLGDIAIGLTAPWVTLALIRRESFRFSMTIPCVESLGDTGPYRCRNNRRAQFRACGRRRRRNHNCSNGSVASCANPGILCSNFCHVASSSYFSELCRCSFKQLIYNSVLFFTRSWSFIMP